MCVAVKADAYGHGIVQVGRAAVQEGVEMLAAATVDEAVMLREAGISVPLLIYSLPIPEELSAIVEYGLTPLVADVPMVRELSQEAEAQQKSIAVHMKIDTGMGRIGCRPEDALQLAREIARSRRLHLAGVSTHFAGSDMEDKSFTAGQIAIFTRTVESIRAAGIDPGILHAANSGAVIDCPDSYFDMIRPGILIYGYYPSDAQTRTIDIRPVMELESQVVFLKRVQRDTPISYGMTYRTTRETVIGTVPAGYGDGYSRLLSNRARILANGESFPLVGRVCMDQCMVDLGPNPDVARYDKVTLFGPDRAGPDAEELARTIGTIAYEVTCAISRRVPRVYVDEPAAASEDLRPSTAVAPTVAQDSLQSR